MNLREMQTQEETMDAKNTTQKLNQSSQEQMLLSKVKELTEALENNKQHLQDEKEEKEEFRQELETEKNRNSTLSSQNSELMKVLEESQSKHRSEVQNLQKELQTALKQNDDLRNKEGLKTKREIESILKKDRELEDIIAEKDKFIKMSNVEAVRKAESDAMEAWSMAGIQIRQNNEEHAKRIREAERKTGDAINRAKLLEEKADFCEDVSACTMFISCGVLLLFLIFESLIHRGFWNDLFHFFYIPLRWLFSQWLPLLSKDTEIHRFLLWSGRIGIPLAVMSGSALIIGLIILTVKRRCMLTYIYLIISTGAMVILGDLFPFNRIIPLFGLVVIYHVVYEFVDRKRKGSNQWHNFRDFLIAPKAD